MREKPRHGMTSSTAGGRYLLVQSGAGVMVGGLPLISFEFPCDPSPDWVRERESLTTGNRSCGATLVLYKPGQTSNEVIRGGYKKIARKNLPVNWDNNNVRIIIIIKKGRIFIYE